MRLVLCTSGGLAGALVLERLRSGPGIEIAGLVRSTRILSPRYGFLRGAWEQYRRSGLRYAVYLGISIAGPLRANGVPQLDTKNVNENTEFVARCAPDLIVSAFFNQKIAAPLARLAKLGAVNIHPSLLPAFRGVDPVFHARLRGGALGVSVHRVSPELDCGDIIIQESISLNPEDSVLRTTARLYERGARLLIESLDTIGAAKPQQGAGAYDSWPTRAQVAALRGKGVRLVALRDLLGS